MLEKGNSGEYTVLNGVKDNAPFCVCVDRIRVVPVGYLRKESNMEQLKKSFVAGVGAANVDVHGRSRKAIVMRDSNPGYMATSVGGVTRNILENLARQGVSTALLTAVGDDLYGRKICEDSSAAGIDMSHVQVHTGSVSSSYIAILDERGDMLLGMSDMRIIEHLEGAYLEENEPLLKAAAAIVCDACLPVTILEKLIGLAGTATPVLIDPVSTAYARQMKPVCGGFFAIKPNEMELSVLSGMPVETETQIIRAAEALLARGTKAVAVSRGDKGCYYADAKGRSLFRAMRPLERMANATGAGDAFMAGFTHGFVENMPIEETLDYALASGVTAIQSLTTINPAMSDALVRENIERYRITNG